MSKTGLMYKLQNGGRETPFPVDDKSWANPSAAQPIPRNPKAR